MASPGSTQPPIAPSRTENPIVAVGRRVKSALSSQQEPSVQIQRGASSSRSHSKALTEKLHFSHHGPERRLGRGQLDATDSDGSPPPVPPKDNVHATHSADVSKQTGKSFWSRSHRDQNVTNEKSRQDNYDRETVDLLDVMDPEVSTLSTLTNVQNSLFVPSLGRLVNRRATYKLDDDASEESRVDKIKASLKRIASSREEDEKAAGSKFGVKRKPLRTKATLDNAQYAVLPDNATLVGWTEENKAELDDMVRHSLHSRRAKFKRSWKGFKKYVRKPLGLFVTVYATLITLFGAAWVLFLIGWISVGSKKDYVVNVVDNVLVALFAIMGDGLAPFRAVDTYHMIYIAHYHRISWKKREKLGLPELVDHNDLPEQRKEDAKPNEIDIESLVARRMPRGLAKFVAPKIPQKYAKRMIARNGTTPSYDYSVLTPEQQAKLDFHERKFSKSHTFYKPHETETHYAFPLKLLVAIVVVLDCHSCLQISLGACTWGIPYQTRPFALTTVILCFSITCNIMGGVLISQGDKRTRKHDVIERMMRQELTSEAIEEMETRWQKEAEARGEIDPEIRRRREEQREEQENEEIKKSWKSVPILPKTLLGKGVDHRQPSLPQEARRSSASVGAGSSSTKVDQKSKSGTSLPSVQENTPQLPRGPSVAGTGGDPLKEGKGQKALRFFRKADLDRS